MGNSPSRPNGICKYSESEDSDFSAVYRAASHPNELVTSIPGRQDITSSWHLFQEGLQKAGRHGLCLGARLKQADGTLGDYSWMTYGQLEARALSFGSSLLDNDMVPEVEMSDDKYSPARKLRLLGVYMKNCRQWVIAEQACNAYKVALVPLYDTLGQGALSFILKHTGLTTCVCSKESVSSILLAVKNAGTENYLQNIIVVGDLAPLDKTEGESLGMKFFAWDRMKSESLRKIEEVTQQDVNTICYTSGTTGTPKGVIITHGQFVSVVAGALRGPLQSPLVALSTNDVHISYLPLPHVFERVFVTAIVYSGGRVGFYSGDVMKLVDDIMHLVPTIFISVPRFYMRINDRINATISEKSAVARTLFNKGINSKVNSLQKDGSCSSMLWDRLIFSKIAKILGGKLRFMVSGGAPLDKAVQERMQVLFCAPLMEGYGLTETMGGSFLRRPDETVFGQVGGPIPALEFKLQSVKEMNYLVSNNPPAGELLLRGPSVTPGYYRNEEATNELFSEGNWMHTGDIVILIENVGIKIVDRKKAIFKLSQGEYVAPEKIEQVYIKASLVSQIFVHGESVKNCLIAVVVPCEEQSGIWYKQQGKQFSYADAAKDPTFKKALSNSMKEVEGELRGFEKVRDFVLATEAFSPENGLLTPTFKIRRQSLKEVYGEQLTKLYSSIE